MAKAKNEFDEMRAEYRPEDMKNAVRGKHFRAYWAGRGVAVLDPDVARAFPTNEAVNDALRRLVSAGKTAGGRKSGGKPVPKRRKPPRRRAAG